MAQEAKVRKTMAETRSCTSIKYATIHTGISDQLCIDHPLVIRTPALWKEVYSGCQVTKQVNMDTTEDW